MNDDGRPEEIALAALWLCSPGASYLFGRAMVMNGGLTVLQVGAGSAPPERPNGMSNEEADGMKIRIKVGDQAVTATLIDNETARDFVSLLPLTLTMNDLFRREKFAHLPRAISTGGKRVHNYQLGDIAYWSPGPDVAIFYRHDGEKIPDPGSIVVGKIDSGVEAFNVPGSVKVTVQLVKEGPR